MVVLHGWINLRVSDQEVQLILEGFNESNGISMTKAWMNGEVVYNLFVCHNHFGESFTMLFRGLSKIAMLESPDSYGLIYMLNEDDPDFFDNWQVWKFAKNTLTKVDSDSYLSPYSKEIAWYPDDDT